MSYPAVRGRRLALALALLAALACTGFGLLLTRTPSAARAEQAVVAPTSSHGCANSGKAGAEFFFSEGAPKLLSETDLRVCVTGRLTVTFAGDPATGCAVHGLCGYAGTDSFEPDGIGEMDIAAYAGRGGHRRAATMVLGGVPGGPVVSAVQRTQTSGTTTACRDRQSSGGFFSLPVSGDRVTIGLAHTETAFLGTRCAGPLEADIAAALPSQTSP